MAALASALLFPVLHTLICTAFIQRYADLLPNIGEKESPPVGDVMQRTPPVALLLFYPCDKGTVPT
jgi:hypothetical protein